MKKTIILFGLFLHVIFCASGQKTNILYDISLKDSGNILCFSNNRLTLSFDKSDGSWLELKGNDAGFSLITSGLYPDFNLKLYKTTIPVKGYWKYENYRYSLSQNAEDVDLVLLFNACDSLTGEDLGMELEEVFTLTVNSNVFSRRIAFKNNSDTIVKISQFDLGLSGICIQKPSDCYINAPGPWFPHSYIKPDCPYTSFADRDIPFMHGSPDGGFGLLSIGNKIKNITLSTWMNTGDNANYEPALPFKDGKLSFVFKNYRAYRVSPGQEVRSDKQIIILNHQTFSEVLPEYEKMHNQKLDSVSPDWVKQMILLEIYPEYFKDGFKGITKKLSFYRDVGFNAIYLMPHWQGGYMPVDFYKINPLYGSEDELKELVHAAHKLGMKVFFDMVIHGFSPSSPLLQEHPEFFVHDNSGNICKHPVWGSMSTNWANKAYQGYMARLALHDIETYDIDGYRFDAASFKGPDWDPQLTYPAYLSGSSSLQVMDTMLQAMRVVKPDAMILNEIFGPAFYKISNLAHDNNTEAIEVFLQKLQDHQVCIQDYKTHIIRVYKMLPKGANRVFYSRNHDTSWFFKFKGYTPAFMAMEGIHALCTIPEVFAGDRGTINPDDDPSVFKKYKHLFDVKRQNPAFSYGQLRMEDISTSSKDIFSALRVYKNQYYMVLINFSGSQLNCSLTFSNSVNDHLSNDSFEVNAIYDSEKSFRAYNFNNLKLDPYEVYYAKLPVWESE